MCGIAGIRLRERRPADWLRDRTVRMARTIAHRGPDHEGVWLDNGQISLANRRLAIVDLSPEGEQPMRSADGRHVIVLNGEIYNFVELRAELESDGLQFRGHSDTEVLLAAINRWGLAPALERAVGMFALAVWDAVDSRLTLARDRAGKKPLYYAREGDAFYFASEIKALRDGAGLALSTDPEAIHHYLSLGYVPSPLTAYREIREVPAGCWMRIEPNLTTRVERYWALPEAKENPISLDEAIEETERRLTVAVTQRLRADVPVGAFLSGGIDSGLMTAIAAGRSSKPVKTFTVTFGGGWFDEGPLAAQVVERYGTDHQAIHLSPAINDLLPRVVRSYDEPFADPSAVPTYAVAEAAGRKLKVVLNGEGADELFGGYRRSVAARYASPLAGLLEGVPGVRAVVNRLPRPGGFRTPYALAYRMLRGFGLGPMDRYLVWSSDGFTEEEKQALYRERRKLPSTTGALEVLLARLAGRPPVDHFMAVDFVLSLGDCLLVKMDIATMAHSLEARSPYLDHRLVEWAAALPRHLLFSARTTKPLLRRLAAKYLPGEVLSAPKRGFEIPLVDWVRGELFSMIGDLCLSQSGLVSDMFDRGQVERLLFRKTGLDDERWAKRLWILLMLAQWDKLCRPGASPVAGGGSPTGQS